MKITIETPVGDHCGECPFEAGSFLSSRYCRYFHQSLGWDVGGTTKCPRCMREQPLAEKDDG